MLILLLENENEKEEKMLRQTMLSTNIGQTTKHVEKISFFSFLRRHRRRRRWIMNVRSLLTSWNSLFVLLYSTELLSRAAVHLLIYLKRRMNGNTRSVMSRIRSIFLHIEMFFL